MTVAPRVMFGVFFPHLEVTNFVKEISPTSLLPDSDVANFPVKIKSLDMINLSPASHSRWWNSNQEKLSSGSQTGGEENCRGPGQAVPGPDREDHDGEGPRGGEVLLHSLQEREGGQRVQETQQREIFWRGSHCRPVTDWENISEGEKYFIESIYKHFHWMK